ncbi:MAG: hypothetical protein PHO26_02340 [Dehalococcoidia bacterium]|nr:hypothetical protein [Dehalococcoidia bacterium]MDD5494980.1 hypothetical protein [Dehalococcoidia bacterium]
MSDSYNYDPTKYYATFLVINTESGKNALEKMKLESVADNMTIGPVEYYTPGSYNYEPLIRKLTQNKQVRLLWLIAPMREVIEMQNIANKIEFKGAVRYMPILPGYSQ